MCDSNHRAFANAGYLFNVKGESVAADGALFTRMLAHHRTVGLDAEQIAALLDLNREYHDAQNAIRIEMSVLAEQVELKRGRVDHDAVVDRKPALDRRAELFAADEMLFFDYAARGQALLTDEQVAAANAVYHSEKDDGLYALAESLSNAVGPTFRFVAE